MARWGQLVLLVHYWWAAPETIQATKAQIKAYADDRSFIKRIDLDKPNGGTIEYSVPLVPINRSDRPHEKGGHSAAQEVLSFRRGSGLN